MLFCGLNQSVTNILNVQFLWNSLKHKNNEIQVLWNEEKGCWFDFDLMTCAQVINDLIMIINWAN